MPTSAVFATTTPALALLFDGSGSGVVLVVVAVLVSVVLLATTVAVMWIVTTSPTASVPSVQLIAVLQLPVDDVAVTLVYVPPGRVSVTVVATAADGPALWTVRSNATASPLA